MKLFQRSDLLWSDTAEASGRDFGLSAKAIGDAFVKRAADKALSKFNGHPLLMLTEQMILNLKRNFPASGSCRQGGNRDDTTNFFPACGGSGSPRFLFPIAGFGGRFPRKRKPLTVSCSRT